MSKDLFIMKNPTTFPLKTQRKESKRKKFDRQRGKTLLTACYQ